MLGTVSALRRDWVSKLTRRRGEFALASDGAGRHRVAFDHGILVACLFVLVGLVVLGSVLILLARVTATLPPSRLRACAELDVWAGPAPDGNEALWVDEPLPDGITMTR